MTQYIDKDALVAEIEKRRNYWHSKPGLIKATYAAEEDKDILFLINTLEVKEVDLNDKKCKDLNDDGTCMYATNKTGIVMRCENINCSRKIKVQKGE